MSDLEAVAVQTGQVFYQGRLFERQRIIKLLEEQIMKIETQIDLVSSDDGVSITFLTADIYNLNNYIALIKGEK
jgi:hypothetical protein